jgi:hypothetical protein
MAFSYFGYLRNHDRRNGKAHPGNRKAMIGCEMLELREQLSLTFTEFPLPPAPDPALPYRDLGTIVTGSDGNLWFLQSYSEKKGLGELTLSVGRMTPEGEFTEFPINTESYYSFLTAGEDGNLWISTQSRIYRLTTSGLITDFKLPEEYEVKSIAVTSKSTVWFDATLYDDKNFNLSFGIGRIDLSGKLSFQKTFNRLINIYNIRLGPAGGLWVSGRRRHPRDDFEGNQILGRFQDDQLKVRSYGKGYEFPPMIVGPDRSMWFDSDWWTKNSDRILERFVGVFSFDSQGRFRRFETLTSGFGIATGPDGNLWTIGRSADYKNLPVINRLTPNGIVTVFTTELNLTDNDWYGLQPYITGGPADSIWIADKTNNGKIIQVSNLNSLSGSLDSRFETSIRSHHGENYSKFDNITSLAHPRFAGTAPKGSTVTLYASQLSEGGLKPEANNSSIRLGSVQVNRNGIWQLKSKPTLANGKYLIYAGLGDNQQKTELLYPLSNNIVSPDYETDGKSPLIVARRIPSIISKTDSNSVRQAKQRPATAKITIA